MTALDELLAQTIAELQRFIAVIAAERRTLVAGEINQLPAIAEEKSALATRLASLEAQREAALGAAGFGGGKPAIDAWLGANPDTTPRAAQGNWKRYIELAAQAKRENEINGKLIAASLQLNQQALGALLRESGEAGTYGADGQRKTASGRRPLGRA